VWFEGVVLEIEDFAGAKLALFLGADLVVITRDLRRDIPWAGHLDFPGGGREGGETPEACVLREAEEEVGLILSESDLVWRRRYQRPNGLFWFFAAHLPAARARDIVFGDEGQGWQLMSPDAYCADALAIPHFCSRLQDYFKDGLKRV